MFPSLKLGHLFRIPLYVHWTFWLLPLWVVLAHSSQLPVVVQLAALFGAFGCVILHELGHAMAARGFGIRTRDITLYPIGGVASLERMSDKPLEELAIALAGPAVNVVLAMIFATAAVVASLGGADTGYLPFFLHVLVWTNVIMIVFNMVPAFPMDGGRVFRALLALRLGHFRATQVAVQVGAVLTIALPIGLLLWAPQYASPFLIVIAFFVLTAGQRELAMVTHRERLRQANLFNDPPHEVVDDYRSWPRPAVVVQVWDPRAGVWVRQEP